MAPKQFSKNDHPGWNVKSNPSFQGPPASCACLFLPRLCLITALASFSLPLFAQLTAEQTGVPTEVLQHNFDDYMSFSYSHGQLCQRTLKQMLPGVRGLPQDLVADLNVAGILTSRWKQEVTRPDGTKPAIWHFECVSQIRAGRKLNVLSLVMYEQRGAERRGIELLTRRDVRIVHEPR